MTSRPTICYRIKKKKVTEKEVAPTASVVEKTTEENIPAATIKTSKRSVTKRNISCDVKTCDETRTNAVETVRPVISSLGHHKSKDGRDKERDAGLKRPFLVVEKGKGPAFDSQTKKSHRNLPTLSPCEPVSRGVRPDSLRAAVELYDDTLAAASLMSRFTYPGDRFSITKRLLKSKQYKEFLSRHIKMVVHCNRLILAYDTDSRSKQNFIDEARKKEEAETQRVGKRMKEIGNELESFKKNSNNMHMHLHNLGVEKKKGDLRIAEAVDWVP